MCHRLWAESPKLGRALLDCGCFPLSSQVRGQCQGLVTLLSFVNGFWLQELQRVWAPYFAWGGRSAPFLYCICSCRAEHVFSGAYGEVLKGVPAELTGQGGSTESWMTSSYLSFPLDPAWWGLLEDGWVACVMQCSRHQLLICSLLTDRTGVWDFMECPLDAPLQQVELC